AQTSPRGRARSADDEAPSRPPARRDRVRPQLLVGTKVAALVEEVKVLVGPERTARGPRLRVAARPPGGLPDRLFLRDSRPPEERLHDKKKTGAARGNRPGGRGETRLARGQ